MNVLEELKKVNEKRSIEGFKTELKDWKISEWSNAVAGEVGELCNLCKKVDRGDFITRVEKENVRNAIAKEAADIVIYLDLLCTREEINLEEAIASKFNEVSVRIGSEIKIPV